MIDVVFNLIVFFLVASHFSRAEPKDEVALPSATQLTEAEQQPHRLIVTVLPDGRYSVGARPVSLTDIEAMISEGREKSADAFAVHIRGDRGVPYEFIEPLLLACARGGVTSQVLFHVVPR
jgi:biopolymer transport protein ExbD